MHRVQLAGERASPVTEDVGHRQVVGHAEGEVQVGEAVPAVDGKRPHVGSGNHSVVVFREPQQALAQSVALLNGEHAARVYSGLRERPQSKPCIYP